MPKFPQTKLLDKSFDSGLDEVLNHILKLRSHEDISHVAQEHDSDSESEDMAELEPRDFPERHDYQ